jgi:YD repeat-containing protein
VNSCFKTDETIIIPSDSSYVKQNHIKEISLTEDTWSGEGKKHFTQTTTYDVNGKQLEFNSHTNARLNDKVGQGNGVDWTSSKQYTLQSKLFSETWVNEITHDSGSSQYIYNLHSQPISVLKHWSKNNYNSTITYSYDSLSRLINIEDSEGGRKWCSYIYKYDNANRIVAAIRLRHDSGYVQPDTSWRYFIRYDEKGRITRVDHKYYKEEYYKANRGRTLETTLYTYDASDNLIKRDWDESGLHSIVTYKPEEGFWVDSTFENGKLEWVTQNKTFYKKNKIIQIMNDSFINPTLCCRITTKSRSDKQIYSFRNEEMGKDSVYRLSSDSTISYNLRGYPVKKIYRRWDLNGDGKARTVREKFSYNLHGQLKRWKRFYNGEKVFDNRYSYKYYLRRK